MFWPHDARSDSILDLEYVYVDDQRYAVVGARVLQKGIEVQLEGITSPEAAKALTHAKVSVEKDLLPALDQDEYYLEDLRGLRVEDENGVARGEVVGFTDTGAQTLLDVKVAPGKIVLVPAVAAFIVRVEPKVRVVVRAIEGLFE